MKTKNLFILTFILLGLISCGSREELDTAQITPEQKEVIKEVEVEVIREVVKTVIKEVPAEVEPVTPSERVNLVVNGSFEEGHDLSDGQWGVYEEILGWKAHTEEINAPIEVQQGNIGQLFPSNGRSKIELDSHDKAGFTASDAHVYQDVVTVAEDYYFLAFDYAPRVESDSTTSDVEVYYDGELIATLTGNKRDWTHYEFLVQSTTDLTRIEFRALLDNDTLGGYIDNVTLHKY